MLFVCIFVCVIVLELSSGLYSAHDFSKVIGEATNGNGGRYSASIFHVIAFIIALVIFIRFLLKKLVKIQGDE